MKPIQFTLTLAMAFVPAVLLAVESPPTYTQGDIFMGFRATGGEGLANTYLVNIGPAATYRDATTTVTPAIGNIGADLVAIYGPDWSTRTDLVWGIAGSPSNVAEINGDAAKVVYASRAELTPGTPGAAWNGFNGTQRGDISTKIQTMASITTGFRSYNKSSNSDFAVSEGVSDGSSWAAFMSGGSQTTSTLDFGAFEDIEAVPSQTLSLFRIFSATTPSTYEGHFSISATGVLTFTPAAAAGTTYATWAATNVNNETQNLDHDGDGVPNGVEFFMGENGSTFTANPKIAADQTITWPRATDRTVSSVVVQVSTDLVSWVPAPSGAVYNASSVVYTVPTGQSKYFVRLQVNP